MKTKPLIVHIAAYYPPHLGGLERVAQEVAEQLARDEYKVLILTSDVGAKELSKIEIHPNLTIKRLWSFDFAHTPIAPGLVWQLLNLPKGSIVHLHLSQVYWADLVFWTHLIKRFKYVIHFHLDVERSGKLGFIFDWWKRWIQPFIVRGAAQVVTLSHEQSTIIHERYRVPTEKITFIPNGVGESFFVSSIKKEAHNPIRLLYVGRLDVQKTPQRLIDMMSKLSIPAELTFVGDGELRNDLEKQVNELKLSNVTFAGKKYGKELIEYYKNSDAFVISSDREGMPLVVLEAMAAALPIIGTNVLGITELVKDVGMLIDQPYAENFAKAVETIVADKSLYENLSRQSLETAKAHTWVELVQRLEDIYKELSS